MKKHEFLGWEPYKPLIFGVEDLRAFLPRDKHDLDNLQLLKNLGWPAIEPVLPDLLEWVQHMNWPVARSLAPFLAGLGQQFSGNRCKACSNRIRKVIWLPRLRRPWLSSYSKFHEVSGVTERQ